MKIADVSRTVLTGASAYAGGAFAIGFALGAARVFLIAPRVGVVGAVLIELPIILAASWFVAGWAIRRFAVPPTRGALITMGAIAFVVLQGLEFALAIGAFGTSPRGFFANFAGLPGALGLAGQLVFAAIPTVRGSIAARR